jgi:hypothetical protein
MASPRLIVCERTPRWLAAWRRALPPRYWNWLATAVSLAQVDGRLREFPGSVVAVGIDAENLATAVQKLHQWRWEFRRARFIALLSNDLAVDAATIAVLQEAGAILTIDRREQLRPAVRLVQRHFRRHIAEELPWREAVWQRLPWPQYATTANSI